MVQIRDSGAALLNEKNYCIGLLMGGSDTCTAYNDINEVLKELKVRIMDN